MTHVAATLFGPPLPDGGTIGVCAPSGPYFNRSDILRPIEWWESKGYRVKLSEGVWAKDDYVAGSPERRAADLNALFADPEVDVIQVLWGGTGAIDVLPYLDYDLIAANPKALMGYSDITNLHIAIRQRTGLATFHGPGPRLDGDPRAHGLHLELRARGVHGRVRPGRSRAIPTIPTSARSPAGKVTGPDRRRQPVHVRPPDRHAVRSGVRRRDPLLRGGARAAVRDRRAPEPADDGRASSTASRAWSSAR